MINEFRGEYRWLSNFWPCAIEFEGIKYPYSEHAYQAAKTVIQEERLKIAACKTPGEAKRMGQTITMRPKWDVLKDSYMYIILQEKFSNPDLKKMLLDTGDEELIETGNWHDNYWGSCVCTRCKNKGQNRLGILLMAIRKEIKDGKI